MDFSLRRYESLPVVALHRLLATERGPGRVRLEYMCWACFYHVFIVFDWKKLNFPSSASKLRTAQTNNHNAAQVKQFILNFFLFYIFSVNFVFFVLQYYSLKSFIVGYITSSLNNITSNFDSEDKSKFLFFLQNISSNFNFIFSFERKAMWARPELCPGVNGTTIVAVEFAVNLKNYCLNW